MGVARAAGRTRRQDPDRGELAAEVDGLAERLGLAAPALAASAVLAVAGAVAAATVPLPAAVGEPGAAYAFVTVTFLTDWFTALPTVQAAWAAAGTLALASLLASGWSVPRDLPSLRRFLRTPSAAVGTVLGAGAPGQLPYAVVGLLGLLLPKSTDRLLARSR